MRPPADIPGFPDDVSRETRDRLTTYATLLRTWSPRINLVSRGTLDDIWTRHFADSAQLVNAAPDPASPWLDLGSGAGFPGLIVALLRPDVDVTLVESDARKVAFLRTVIRETGIAAQVLNRRIETMPPFGARVLSARALAPLTRLLSYADCHLAPGGTALFPKGERFREEVDTALETWTFRCDIRPSRTDPGAVILKISEIARA